jgi:ketosteroid isomerase-like protein
VVLLLTGLVVFSVACRHGEQVDAHPTGESGIQAVVDARSQAAADRDLEKLVWFYADDASVLPFNAPSVTGKGQVQQFWSRFISNRGYALRLSPTKEEVARSGDLAYEVGTFDLTLGDSEGKTATNHGKYITVWKRQVNGDWKAEDDIYNMDL